MFTGIIEEVGRVVSLQRTGSQSMQLRIRARKVLEDVQLGDSIAVNGVCLTVVEWTQDGVFAADVMPETMKRTNLGDLQPGSPVNLERAMSASDRFGGHMVTGHVDTTGRIAGRQPLENAVLFTISAPDELLEALIPKGSVAIDGISLTVVDVEREAGQFSVSIIPHTLAHTNLQERKIGDVVNLEADMVAKYIRHYLSRMLPMEKDQGITEEFLREHGFMA